MRRKQQYRKAKKVYIPLAAMLAVLLPLFGYAEERAFNGDVSLTPTVADVNGSKAKFKEYSDTEDGLYGGVRLNRESDSYYFDFQADDILYDTQSYGLTGGSYGKYKYNLYYNELPHNLTFDAKTPLSGIGSNTLTYTGAGTTLNTGNPKPPSWNTFDYEVDRKKGGGSIRVDLLKPYYFDVAFSQEDREGLKPTATSWNSASGGGGRRILEMPEPVDYITDNLKAEIGYGLNPFFGAVSYQYSKFDNNNNNLYYEHPNTNGNMEALSLPPNNEFYKFAFKGKAILPASSALNVNASHGVAESSIGLRSQYLNDIGAVKSITFAGADTVFDGKVVTTNYDMALTSNPVSYANGKIFYNYSEKKNKSDQITVTDNGTADTFHNHLFGYDKKTIGAEVTFKLPLAVSLTPSYKNVKVERERGDLPESQDNIYGLNARWNGMEHMTVNAGYERLERSADWRQLTSVVPGDQSDAEAIEPFIRRYDAAPLERDTYKVSLDISPSDNLNIGLGYQHKKLNYNDTFIGLRDEKSDTYDVTADYTLEKVSLTGYFTYEVTDYYQFHRRFTSSASASPLDVNPTDGHYNWDINEELKSYDYGISAETNLIPKKLRIKVQYDYVRSDGTADFNLYSPNSYPSIATGGTFTNETLDIKNWDDYRKDSFIIKAIYDINQNLVSTFGYAYEKYQYNDSALDAYDYQLYNEDDYLTGAYKDQSYEANVLFATMKYSF